jgi:hypothetical protein
MKQPIRASLFALLAIFLGGTLPAQHVYHTAGFGLEINSQGQVTGMTDLKNKINYVPSGNPGYLVRIKSNGKDLAPSSVKVQKNLLYFTFEGGIELQVQAIQNKDYLKFELKKAVKTEKIEAVYWGPFNTTIDETIGEVVGVVRNKDFAIGMRALNSKTIGGKLLNEEGVTAGSASITGSAAGKEDFGSAMQAFCLNQSLDRVIQVWHLHKNCPVRGLKNYKIEGTALAMFGTVPDNVLTAIGTISQAEGLPYQVIDGEWVRKSKITGKPYLIASFSEENFDEMLEFTQRLGFYSIYHSHPFDTWGHFDLLKNLFPNGREGMRKCVEKANAKNIRVGVHTLTNFITTNDPFVTTEANSGLMAAGISQLLEDLNESSTEITVDNYDYFAQVSTLNSVLIGNEIVRYQEVTKEKPYRLINCARGAYNTKAAPHKKGDQAKKLMDFPYNTLFPDWEMQDQLIRNLADFFNETGVSQMDFDGHEGACYTGRGEYAVNYFAEEFLKKVDHLVVNGSSNINHFYWNNNSYINWGEPWYASFRESQSEHRFKLQPFFERNYMPNMLGWFLMTPGTFVEDIEWMMARAAGYNAGYAFVADYKSLKQNPNTDIIINSIRTWEEAKKLEIFSDEQRVRLKDTGRDFHLEKAGSNHWMLQNFEKFKFEHAKKILQPGEPAHSKWEFNNAWDPQLLHLQLLVTGDDASRVVDIEIEVDNYFKVKIPAEVKKGQTLVWDSSKQIKLYNDKGQFIKAIDIERSLPELKSGKHLITINAGSMDGAEPVIKGTIKLKSGVEEIRK